MFYFSFVQIPYLIVSCRWILLRPTELCWNCCIVRN